MQKQSTFSLKSSADNRIIDPLQDSISSIELIRISGSDIDIVNAARVSYGKHVTQISDNDHKLITYLLKHRHTSPFEHNQLSFRIKAPIFVVRQWMRHRMNSYNEISYRYVKAKLEFYIPSYWRYQDTINRQGSAGQFNDTPLLEQYRESLQVSAQTYERLLQSGVAREIARGVLPLCTYTEFIFTCNLHSFMNFLELRAKLEAQYEIRVYAIGMFNLALPFFPVSLEEWKKQKNMSL
ncbi:MAG TPA: FAD-dependent thymidylate synthase [Candidatus Babeliales bacterium]|nr:FAD-dependent thymidylate synthase [Candidatus Babeliales bacterium]